MVEVRLRLLKYPCKKDTGFSKKVEVNLFLNFLYLIYMATSLPYIIVDLLGILLMILKSGFPCMNCELRFYR